MTFARRRRLFLIAMMIPAAVYVAIIGVWPLVQGIWFSLFEYNLIRPHRTQFLGLGNYVSLLTEQETITALRNTVVFTFGAVAIQLFLGFLIALALWKDELFNRICLALILIPVTVTPLVVGLIFKGLLLADNGQIGYYLARWGLTDPRGLFADPETALATLIAVDIWEWTPLVALILLAGLKALPEDVLEAAKTDGATAWQRLWIVVLPLMLPSVMLAVTLRTVDAFRVFDIIFVTTSGGPGDATNTLMLHAVKEGLQFFNIGMSSAISNLTLLCIAVIATVFVLGIRQADKKAFGE